jgi:CRISPR-associated protein Cas1
MAATCRSIAVSSSSQDREEVGRIPLDDVHAVLLHAHGTTWSANLIAALAERGAPVGMRRQPCPRGDDFAPVGHHAQNARFRAQWNASVPLTKQLAATGIGQDRDAGRRALARGGRGRGFPLMARRVKSGDSDNLEAQAARRLAPADGRRFRRDRDSPGANALLNGSVAKIVKLEHAWRRLDGRNDDGFQVAPFPG